MERKGSFLDPSFSPTMEILRGISMGAQFLLTLPIDFSISLHSTQFGGRRGPSGQA